MNDFYFDKLLDINKTISEPLFLKHKTAYKVLPYISDFFKEVLFDLKDYEEIKKCVFASKYAKISSTAEIQAPCIIGHYTEIRHGAYIRGNAIIGNECVVGNSTEIKNSILFDNVQVPHYNYVGDSCLGYKSHMGAGSITSNVKSDKSLVTIKYNGKIIETGLKKFGAIIGDNVEIGCSAVLNPGSIIFKNSNIYPLTSVRGVVPENSIYKNKDEIITKT